MIRNVLLAIGCMVLFVEQNVMPINDHSQFLIFLAGILLLGVPHGAADLLVAARTADAGKKTFSKLRFLLVYISRLLLFGLVLRFLPVPGILLFIVFAAYHFGETDLFRFNTNTLPGKAFVISYGLLILSVLLLHHFEEVKAVIQLYNAGKNNDIILNWIDKNRYYLLSISGIIFFTTTFIYFLLNRNTDTNGQGQFLIRLAVILFILFSLPMLLGFTFYFVVWHSVVSLGNIISYLRANNAYTLGIIIRQIIFYSALAITGIGMVGLGGFMYLSSNAVAGSIFLGLAVLTAPHLQIMHDMYNNLRLNKSI